MSLFREVVIGKFHCISSRISTIMSKNVTFILLFYLCTYTSVSTVQSEDESSFDFLWSSNLDGDWPSSEPIKNVYKEETDTKRLKGFLKSLLDLSANAEELPSNYDSPNLSKKFGSLIGKDRKKTQGRSYDGMDSEFKSGHFQQSDVEDQMTRKRNMALLQPSALTANLEELCEHRNNPCFAESHRNCMIIIPGPAEDDRWCWRQVRCTRSRDGAWDGDPRCFSVVNTLTFDGFRDMPRLKTKWSGFNERGSRVLSRRAAVTTNTITNASVLANEFYAWFDDLPPNVDKFSVSAAYECAIRQC